MDLNRRTYAKPCLFERLKNIAARSSILLFFIMAVEVMIMISLFAFFSYPVFNSVIHWLKSFPATGWFMSFPAPQCSLAALRPVEAAT